jgi:hypothetical protein
VESVVRRDLDTDPQWYLDGAQLVLVEGFFHSLNGVGHGEDSPDFVFSE